MMRVGLATAPGQPPPAAPAAVRPEQGFRLPPRGAPCAASAVGMTVGLIGLSAVLPSARDALARKRGRAMLGGLDALQRALLSGVAADPALRTLAGLVDGEDGEDPETAETLRALSLRARIELARREGVTVTTSR